MAPTLSSVATLSPTSTPSTTPTPSNTPSPTLSATPTPTAQPVRALAAELVGVALRAAVLAASPALLLRTGPATPGLRAVTAAPSWPPADEWRAWDVLTLYASGALSSSLAAAPSPPAPPGAQGASVVLSNEPLVLLADVWAFQALDVGAQRGVALGHGVPLAGGSAWLLPRTWVNESAAAFAAPTTGGGGTSGWSYEAPSAILFSVKRITWTLRGVPSLAVSDANATSHTLTLSTPTAALTIAPTTLRAGFVYSASLRATTTAAWSYLRAADVASWDPWLPPQQGAPPLPLAPQRVLYNANDTVADAPPLTSAFSPSMYVHAPPTLGVLSVTSGSPPAESGIILLSTFNVTTSSWVDGDARALSSLLLSSNATAASLLTSFAANSAAPAALLSTLGWWPQQPSVATPSACPVTDPLVPEPAWLRAWTIVADALTLDAGSSCDAALAATSSALALLGTPAPQQSLTFLYRVSLGATAVAVPALLGSAGAGAASGAPLSWASVIALQANASVLTFNPPGVALASATRDATIASGLMLPSVGGEWGATTVLVLAVDAYGAVGASVAQVSLLSPVTNTSQSSDAPALLEQLNAATAAALAPGGSEAGNALGTIALASVTAQLLVSLQTLQSSGASGTAVLPGLAAAQWAAISSVAGAVAALTASAQIPVAPTSAFAGAPGIDDASLALVAGSLSSLTAAAAVANSSLAASVQGAVLEAVYGALTLAVSAGKSVSEQLAAGQAPIAASTAANMLNAISNVVAVSGNASAAQFVGSYADVGAGAVRALLNQSLAALTSAILRGVAPNTAATTVVSSGLPAGALVSSRASQGNASRASFCGAGIVLTAARVQLSAALPTVSITIATPLAPCLALSQSLGLEVTLPPTFVAPAPAIVLSRAALVATGAKADSAVDVQLTQFGWAPESETAGMGAMNYASTTAIDAGARARRLDPGLGAVTPRFEPVRPSSDAGGGTSPARTLLSLSSLRAGLSSLLSSSASASQQSASALLPQPLTVQDAMPSHPIDSRVLRVQAVPAGGTVVAAAAAPSLNGVVFNYTIPLRDTGTVLWNRATQTVSGVQIGQSLLTSPALNITCPSSPAGARAGIYAVFADSSPGAPVRARVWLLNATAVTWSTVSVGVSDNAALSGASAALDAAAIAAPDGANSSAVVAYAYALSADCGPAFGNASLLCGAGTAGVIVPFQCPAAVPRATCLWYDAPASVWSQDRCTVASQSTAAITCSCARLADVAVRFAGLPDASQNVYSNDAPLVSVLHVEASLVLLGVLAALTVLLCVGAVVGCVLDNVAADAFAAALGRDAELTFCSGQAPPLASLAVRPAWRTVPSPARSARPTLTIGPEALRGEAVPQPCTFSGSARTIALWLRLEELLEARATGVPLRARGGSRARRGSTAGGFSSDAHAPVPWGPGIATHVAAFDAALCTMQQRGTAPAPPSAAAIAVSSPTPGGAAASNSTAVAAAAVLAAGGSSPLSARVARAHLALVLQQRAPPGAHDGDAQEPDGLLAPDSVDAESPLVRVARMLPFALSIAWLRFSSPLRVRMDASRVLSATLALSDAVFSLFVAAFLIANVWGSPSRAGTVGFSALPVSAAVPVAGVTAVATLVAHVLASAAVRAAAAAQYARRHAALHLELQRRALVERLVGDAPTGVVAEELAQWAARQGAPPLRALLSAKGLGADALEDPRQSFSDADTAVDGDGHGAMGSLDGALAAALQHAQQLHAPPARRRAQSKVFPADARAPAEGSPATRAAGACACTCTPEYAAVTTALLIACAWGLVYCAVFALTRGPAACASLLIVWAVVLAVVAALHALAAALGVVWHVAVLPVCALRIVALCPAPCARVLGAATAARACSALDAAPPGFLSARLRAVAIPRAAAAAARLPVDAAVGVFADLGVLAAVLTAPAYRGRAADDRVAVLLRRYAMLVLAQRACEHPLLPLQDPPPPDPPPTRDALPHCALLDLRASGDPPLDPRALSSSHAAGATSRASDVAPLEALESPRGTAGDAPPQIAAPPPSARVLDGWVSGADADAAAAAALDASAVPRTLAIAPLLSVRTPAGVAFLTPRSALSSRGPGGALLLPSSVRPTLVPADHRDGDDGGDHTLHLHQPARARFSRDSEGRVDGDGDALLHLRAQPVMRTSFGLERAGTAALAALPLLALSPYLSTVAQRPPSAHGATSPAAFLSPPLPPPITASPVLGAAGKIALGLRSPGSPQPALRTRTAAITLPPLLPATADAAPHARTTLLTRRGGGGGGGAPAALTAHLTLLPMRTAADGRSALPRAAGVGGAAAPPPPPPK